MEGPGPFVTVGEMLAVFAAPPGEALETAPSLRVFAAGAEFNVATGLRRLGVPSAFFGAVGDDPWGRRLVRQGRAEGVDMDGVRVVPDRPTAVLFRDALGPGGSPRVHYLRRAAAGSAYAPDEALARAVGRARGVHTTGISLCLSPSLAGAALAALAGAPAGALRSFDLNVRRKVADPPAWRHAWRQVEERLDVAFATVQELEDVGLDPAEVGEGASRRGTTLVLRDDDGPTRIVGPDGRFEVPRPAPAGPALDTVGAGDAFAAAVLALRLDGVPWPEAVCAGHLAGARSVTVLGDVEGSPDRSELDRLRAGTAPAGR